ncbi:MAG: hypothetical protein A3J48_01205 [Candidatus Doudnabacteria bacterium RIFCSPHIGHO2_02_FULL_46_11]|uniref:Uncharacterized protein n=1 Tax=Candidatus Doudnabacteria bacterium RIFCSPHIGHO2_02_FULL_46_11 TaxID=1817832 RepID=A0A1F5P4V3_9BACT|nr:MAG: hypothetical protein A3J48_01205 [Candidatus Doudnabacteria bacterium RIFCSPHIGHO2_02_FULL_46_11]
MFNSLTARIMGVAVIILLIIFLVIFISKNRPVGDSGFENEQQPQATQSEAEVEFFVPASPE